MVDKKRKPLVVIMAGGTGGHIFPGLAVARTLAERGAEIFWLGSSNGMESKLVPQHKYSFSAIKISGLRGRGIIGWLFAPLKVSLAFWSALKIFLKKRPALVIGMGGFVAGPGGLAAFVANIPLVIHEQNATAGLTNRLLSPLSERILTGFPDVLSSKRTEYVGNPVYVTLPSEAKPRSDDCLHLLVVGGSLGAEIFNRVVPEALALLNRSIQIQVKQQCGQGNARAVSQRAEELKLPMECFDFTDNIGELYQWADLVLCRAGAMTTAEIMRYGKASIMVPFPYAVGNHQTANAQFLSNNSACILIEQQAFNMHQLAKALEGLAGDRERIERIANNANKLGCSDSSDRIADICFEVAKI